MYYISCTQVEQESSTHRNMQPIWVCTRSSQLLTHTQWAAPGTPSFISCHVRLGISTWLSTRKPLAWKQLCWALVFPFCFASVPRVESLRSHTMALKGHDPCAQNQWNKPFSSFRCCSWARLSALWNNAAVSLPTLPWQFIDLALYSWLSRGQQFMQHTHPGFLGSCWWHQGGHSAGWCNI